MYKIVMYTKDEYGSYEITMEEHLSFWMAIDHAEIYKKRNQKAQFVVYDESNMDIVYTLD